jgi:phosphonate transport system substrate-binding protein
MITLYLRKRIFIFLILFIQAFAAFTSLASKADAREESLVIGLVPEMNIFKQRERFELLAPYLSKNLGIEVRLTILTYGNIIEKFKKEEIDAAFLGSFTGALAISQLGVVPLVRPINMDNTSTYQGYIFVRKDSNITSVADMKGKSMALVEKTTAGFVFPMAWLKRHGIDDISTFFNEQFISGSHDRTISLVLNGKANVGAAKSTIYKNMRKWQPRIDSELVILTNSPKVPSNTFCVSKKLDQQYRGQLKDLLLNLRGDSGGREVLKKLGAKRFVETGRDQYQPVFDLAKEAGIDLGKYDFQSP